MSGKYILEIIHIFLIDKYLTEGYIQFNASPLKYKLKYAVNLKYPYMNSMYISVEIH